MSQTAVPGCQTTPRRKRRWVLLLAFGALLGLVASGGYLAWAYQAGGMNRWTAFKIKKGQTAGQVDAIVDVDGDYRRTGERIVVASLVTSDHMTRSWLNRSGILIVYFNKDNVVIDKSFTPASLTFLDKALDWVGIKMQ
jgi:hypothetical protein